MGIYVFNSDVLAELLLNTHCRDFGKEVFPSMKRTGSAPSVDGYWEDIGTIRSFEANLQLARPHAPYGLTTANAPIYRAPFPASHALMGPRSRPVCG
jgi:ADP-glucose pyrophosphorylase